MQKKDSDLLRNEKYYCLFLCKRYLRFLNNLDYCDTTIHLGDQREAD
jgi:hypothetical protein